MRRLAVMVGVAAGLLALSHRVDLSSAFTADGLRALVGADTPWGPVVFMGVVVLGMFLHLPEMVLIGLGAVVFGKAQGFAYGWMASVAGATGIFLLARYFAHDAVQRLLHGRFAWLQRLDERLAQNGFRTVFLLRLFLFLAPPLSYTLATTRVSFPHYVAGTALGVVPGISVAVFSGDALSRGALSGETLLMVATLLAATAVAVGVGRRLRAVRVRA